MNPDKKDLVFKYLQEQIAQADFRAKAYVFDEKNNKNPTRNCFIKLKMHLENFLQGNSSARWIIMSGFRGAGKTTLLAQLYSETNTSDVDKLYLSVDQITHIIGVTLNDALNVYEELSGTAFERREKPLILFLDEVQYDKNWAITLKTLYDRSRQIFIVATGSSAVSLQTNPDIERRAISEKLYPMSFTEYMKIKQNKFEEKGLGSEIRKAIFDSKNAEEVYTKLVTLEKRVRKYWTGIERLEIDRYMSYGTLPFAVKLKNEGLVYDQIKKILDRVISMDIAELGQFKTEVLSRIPEILYAIASSDKLSITNLSKDLSMNKITLTDVLNIIEKTETIVRIYPHGSHISQVRKPSKYLFASPAFRSMYFNFIGSVISKNTYQGKILEDTIGLYLIRSLTNKEASLTYDSAENGADFIVRMGPKMIVIEVGHGKKDYKQIDATNKRVKSAYSLILSMDNLECNEELNTVIIPLTYFFLI